MPAAMAATATNPTTTPAAMPALLVPLPDVAWGVDEAPDDPVAVTTTVCPRQGQLAPTAWKGKETYLPPTVTTDGFADVVAEGVDDDDEVPEEPAAGALVVSPVKYTDQYFMPPPIDQVSWVSLRR